MKQRLVYVQGIIQILVGSSAVVSGLMLMISPSGILLQAPLEMLEGTPFANYFIPGLILFAVNGVGQLIAAYLTLKKKRVAPLMGAVFGLGLMIWMFIQVNMIGGGRFLQYSYFFIGVIETALAFLLTPFAASVSGGKSSP